jgi:hypothetical protein
MHNQAQHNPSFPPLAVPPHPSLHHHNLAPTHPQKNSLSRNNAARNIDKASTAVVDAERQLTIPDATCYHRIGLRWTRWTAVVVRKRTGRVTVGYRCLDIGQAYSEDIDRVDFSSGM